MNICSCEKPSKNFDLRNLNYDSIYLNINKNKLKFCENDNYGVYRLVEKDKNELEKDENVQKLKIEIKNLNNEINEYDLTIKDYRDKIKDMDKKIEKMKNILEIDGYEENYIKDLKDKNKIRYEIKSEISQN